MTDTIEGVAYERRARPGCPFCARGHAARAIAVSFGMTVSVAECPDCRLAYQTPRPSLDASLAYMDMRWRSQDPYVADREAQRTRAQMQLDLVASIAPPRPRILDFGSGIGTFVRAARDAAWDAVGVERSRPAAERAQSENGVALAPDLSAVSGDFDVVTMWDVIEHLRDPMETVAALRRHLRPGGRLVAETGNWESWSRLAAGDAWSLYLFDHQYYFSPSALQSLLHRAGLSEFRLLPVAERPPPARPDEAGGLAALGSWNAYRSAVARWPDHASIDIMVAAVRNV